MISRISTMNPTTPPPAPYCHAFPWLCPSIPTTSSARAKPIIRNWTKRPRVSVCPSILASLLLLLLLIYLIECVEFRLKCQRDERREEDSERKIRIPTNQGSGVARQPRKAMCISWRHVTWRRAAPWRCACELVPGLRVLDARGRNPPTSRMEYGGGPMDLLMVCIALHDGWFDWYT